MGLPENEMLHDKATASAEAQLVRAGVGGSNAADRLNPPGSVASPAPLPRAALSVDDGDFRIVREPAGRNGVNRTMIPHNTTDPRNRGIDTHVAG